MIEHLRDLGLDQDRVRRVRDASVGVGRAYMRLGTSQEDSRNSELPFFAAATNFRRAAAHSLLLDEAGEATQYFHQAATAYLAAGAMYGLFLENLGHAETRADDYPVEVPRHASDMFWLWSPEHLRALSAGERERVGMFRRRLDSYRTENVGMLGIPVVAYLDLFDSLAYASEDAVDDAVAKASFPITAAYSAAIRRAREDRYHWTRLATPFHPLEPDIVGIFLAASRSLKAKNRSLARILAGMPIADDALDLLRGSLGQYDAWNDDEWRRR